MGCSQLVIITNAVAIAITPTTGNVVVNGQHSMAMLNDGTILVWGDGSYGQLGASNTNYSTLPVIMGD